MQAEINVAEGKKQVYILVYKLLLFKKKISLIQIAEKLKIFLNKAEILCWTIDKIKILPNQAQILEAEAGKQGVILAAQVNNLPLT